RNPAAAVRDDGCTATDSLPPRRSWAAKTQTTLSTGASPPRGDANSCCMSRAAMGLRCGGDPDFHDQFACARMTGSVMRRDGDGIDGFQMQSLEPALHFLVGESQPAMRQLAAQEF